jgi:tetratricopeptide (TPR) repeat protein
VEGRVETVQPWLDLAAAQLAQRDLEGVDETLAEIFRLEPDQALALEFRGVRAGLGGDADDATEWLRKAVLASPNRPEGFHNLGLFLDGKGDKQAAADAFSRALELRPNLASSWFHLGRMERLLARPGEAVDALRRCLAIDPGHSQAYVELAEALAGLGEADESARYLRHGSRFARDPEQVRQALGPGPDAESQD